MEFLSYFIVACVRDLLELLILKVVPGLQDVALQPPLAIFCWQKILDFFLEVCSDLRAESFIEEGKEVFETHYTLHVQSE